MNVEIPSHVSDLATGLGAGVPYALTVQAAASIPAGNPGGGRWLTDGERAAPTRAASR
ncbi:hypothetical protein [Streptomyces chartreusis]|uniref:hypothetical protein n=1 Tax=Streptomyces chartreusis TaxID=1969 RepID=UPI0033E8E803